MPERARYGKLFLYVARFQTLAKVGVTVAPRQRMLQHGYAYGGAHGQTCEAAFLRELPEDDAWSAEAYLCDVLRHRNCPGKEWFDRDLFAVAVALAEREDLGGMFRGILLRARQITDHVRARW